MHLVQKLFSSLDGFGLLHDDAISHLSTLVHLDGPLMSVILGVFFAFILHFHCYSGKFKEKRITIKVSSSCKTMVMHPFHDTFFVF
jgi:hypothetical protein